MKKYTIEKIYKYTVTVEVIAESSREAKRIADTEDGERNHDDYLYDCEVVSEEEIETN